MAIELNVQNDVAATVRDGTILRADIYRPARGGPYPVLLMRTPYGKTAMASNAESARALASAGYIAVVQDVRGRFASEGEFRPYFNDVADGYDAVMWAAALAGSTGAVGLFGPSNMGVTQWLAASALPPPLKAIFPDVTSVNVFETRGYNDGAFTLADCLSWCATNAVETADRLGLQAPAIRRAAALRRQAAAAREAGDSASASADRCLAELRSLQDGWLRHLPLRELPVLRGVAPHYYEWLAHPPPDEYWQPVQVERRFPRMDLPAFHRNGWYDCWLRGSLVAFTGLRARARTPEARRAQRLLIGPWGHGTRPEWLGEVYLGPDSVVERLPLQIRWFDHWLKGIDTGLLEEPPVRIYVLGANTWRDEWDWPLARTRYTPFYLHSGGGANTRDGDGALTTEPPGEEPPDHFTYDPNDPVPTLGGRVHVGGGQPGAFDQCPVEARPDVLCYSTPPLARDLEVTGPLSVTLFAASSAPNTDWVAKLVDVQPDGRALNLQEGILRATHRIPGAAPSLIRPGEVYEYEIDLWATSNVFRAGHRIRVEISSSNFPHWDRNPNTGAPFGADDRLTVAHQAIFHDAARPSHILLPVIES
jgi:putative CocE/NonD family hydrolase